MTKIDGKSIMGTGAQSKPRRFRHELTAFAASAAALRKASELAYTKP